MKLPSTINNQIIRGRIHGAALSVLDVRTGLGGNHTVFEHGQWWLVLGNGTQYSVVDIDNNGEHEFDFEEVASPFDD